MGTITHSVEVQGGIYNDRQTGEVINATRWTKDGDYPLVSRYPIEGREYKGILVVAPKEKYSLRFGDWICEDAEGRLFVIHADDFGARFEEAAS